MNEIFLKSPNVPWVDKRGLLADPPPPLLVHVVVECSPIKVKTFSAIKVEHLACVKNSTIRKRQKTN